MKLKQCKFCGKDIPLPDTDTHPNPNVLYKVKLYCDEMCKMKDYNARHHNSHQTRLKAILRAYKGKSADDLYAFLTENFRIGIKNKTNGH